LIFTVTSDIEKFFIEFKQMSLDHKEEIDLFGVPLDPDFDTYRQCFQDNTFLLFEIRNDTELVGYAGFFIYTCLHHKTSLHAKQDILFIRKDYRGHGMKFINYCDTLLKQVGVNVVLHCVPTIKDWSPILTRRGYKKLETVYSKEL
jgi:GNAT superfamily N-acetyltransferase